MPMGNAFDVDELRRLVHYEPMTGVFLRKVRVGNSTQVGDVAGSKNNQGYVMMYVGGSIYAAHRLAWLYMTGSWPKKIDHINGVRDDNRFSNLRAADNAINNQNRRRANGNNKLGLLGVTRCGDKYRATIHAAGKKLHVGLFVSPQEAYSAYLVAKRRMHEGATL